MIFGGVLLYLLIYAVQINRHDLKRRLGNVHVCGTRQSHRLNVSSNRELCKSDAYCTQHLYDRNGTEP